MYLGFPLAAALAWSQLIVASVNWTSMEKYDQLFCEGIAEQFQMNWCQSNVTQAGHITQWQLRAQGMVNKR